MSDTKSDTVNPRKLREEYGPAPWWSEDHLTELVHYHGLDAQDIATIWPVHPATVNDYISQYGIRGDSA
jgi:hypothetical protein